MRRFALGGATGLGLWILLIVSFSISSPAQVIFYDDFNGTTLDSTKWVTDFFSLQRTDFNKGATVAGGNATLRLDTYDAALPGVNLSGSQISTQTIFSRGNGLEFEARFRVPSPVAKGIVAAFFPYHFNPVQQTQDEIDFELLTNQFNTAPNPSRILLTSWNNWDFIPSHGNDGIHMVNDFPAVPGWDPTGYNTYLIRWLPDRVEWEINGTKIWDVDVAVPDEPMPLKLDIWAPDGEFMAAYDSSLVATANPLANTSYAMDVDYVTVRSIPELRTVQSFLVGLILLAAIMRRKRESDEDGDHNRCQP